MLGSICQLPMYECFGCAATRRLPAGVLRVYRDVVWCEECYSEDDVGPDWHDLPAFVPKHEVELAKLREVLAAAKNALPHINDVTNAAHEAEQRLQRAIESADTTHQPGS